MTKKEKLANLAHALYHINANHIADDDRRYGSAWYCGNREQFVERHKKAKAYLEQLIEEVSK